MSDPFEQQEWVKVGVAAAMNRQYAGDQRAFMAELAQMLQGILPDETQIAMRGGLFSKKTLQRLSVRLGEYCYNLEDPGHGSILASRTRIVREIALKTEPVPVPEWIAEICAVLDERAKVNAAAREALAKLVG